MNAKHFFYLTLLSAAPFCYGAEQHSTAWHIDATHPKALQQKVPLKNDDEEDLFVLGRSFFTIPWVAAPSATTARDGLGPLFNANACVSCHSNHNAADILDDQQQVLRGLIFKLSQPENHANKARKQMLIPDPAYGAQVAVNATGTVKPEATPTVRFKTHIHTFPDGEQQQMTQFLPKLTALNYGPLHPQTTISVRQAPALVGLGLLDEIDIAALQAREDPDDRDNNGISGRINWVYNALSGAREAGLFGYKASQPSVIAQTADAAANDMGLTNPFLPNELCQESQVDCQQQVRGRDSPQGLLDLPMQRLTAIALYIKRFKAPQTMLTTAETQQGKTLFTSTGCQLCHHTDWETKSGIKFSPYSDFLLHDMGPDLDDQRPEFSAATSEWRTAPLWGMHSKLHQGKRLLHDGRASNLQEAILWHGGEAATAKENFRRLSRTQRQALLKYLENL